MKHLRVARDGCASLGGDACARDADWVDEAMVRAVASIDDPDEFAFVLSQLPAPVQRRLLDMWSWRAHGGQREPEAADAGGDWRVWLVMAGRGFGKTKAGAEWVWARTREMALAGAESGGGGAAKIALVGGTIDEVRDVMVEGESGIASAARTGEWARWSATRRCVEFSNGATAFAYSGERPEKLRGPEHHFAWCDELAKWGRAEATWDNLQMTLRLGTRPRIMVTTTPRAVPAVRRLLALPDLARTDGTSWENVHLPSAQLDAVTALYGGTRMGRQELGGELIEDAERALFKREVLEAARERAPVPIEWMKRIVVGVDPPGSADGDACGIVVCGLGADGIGYVLADCSEGGLSPDGWARKVAAAAAAWDADRVVAEKNMGGEMVASVLRAAEAGLPLKLVHAAQGKGVRAEPVAALFESGRAKLAGAFPDLEDELAGLTEGGGYEGSRSPDRADAMVWAMRELMLGTPAPVPRARRL